MITLRLASEARSPHSRDCRPRVSSSFHHELHRGIDGEFGAHRFQPVLRFLRRAIEPDPEAGFHRGVALCARGESGEPVHGRETIVGRPAPGHDHQRVVHVVLIQVATQPTRRRGGIDPGQGAGRLDEDARLETRRIVGHAFRQRITASGPSFEISHASVPR